MGSRAGRTSQLWGVRMAGGVDPRTCSADSAGVRTTGPSDNQAYQASPRAYQASHWAHPPIADQATSPARQALRPAPAQMAGVRTTGPSDNQAYQASPRAYQASHWAHPPIADQATSPARQALRPAAAQMTYVQMAALVNCRTRLTGQPGNAQTAGPAGMRMPGALYSVPMNGTAADPPDERSAARRSVGRRSG